MPVESGGTTRSVRRVALLIDCENESAAHADLILRVAASIGRVAQMNAYADWTNPRSKSWAEACKQHGIRQILVNRTPRGKNTVDNYMSAEAAGLAQSGDIDAVCLVTSDSDFSGAATVVRTAGKDVYGIGSAEGAFAASCTDFFRLSKEGGSWVRGQSAPPAPTPLMPPARSEPSAPREAEAAGGSAPPPAAVPSTTPARAAPEKPGGVEGRQRESRPAAAPRPAPPRQGARANLCVCGCGSAIGENSFLQSGHGGRLVGIIGRGDPVEVARVDWGRVPLSFRKGRYEAEIRRYQEQAASGEYGTRETRAAASAAVSGAPPVAVRAAVGTRRCIGIDLAWGERNPTGCVELAWDGGELVLARLDLCRSIQDIVEWIEPDRGDWIVAIDAPLVIRNQTGRRAAEADADRYYRRYQAGAYPSSLDKFGADHRGGRLWRALEERGGELLEQPNMLGRPHLIFETYPHIVMVELFHLDRTIKYKARPGRDVIAGQRQLVNAIREHFCGGAANPRLRSNDALEELLREPRTPISDRALKDREELLDGLVSAYMAAWVDAGRPLRGLGVVGEGVMVVPSVRGIGARAAAVGSPGTAAASRARQPRAPSTQSRAPASPVAPAEARTSPAPRAEGGVLAALRKEPDGSATAAKPQEQPRQDAGGGRRGDRAGTRRLIGVALARGEKGASGCAELAWDGGELVLKRVDLVRTVDEIARWIRPDRGDWIVAAGAPLVVRNEAGRREADKRAGRLYGRYGADAPAVNLKRLGRDHRGGRLLDALKRHRGRLLEKAAPAGAGRAVLETSAQPAMIELLGLDRAIRYRQGSAQVRRAGQRELANAIREHLCRGKAGPRLREDGALGELLHESERLLPDDALRDRGDRLEALICAYAAAWVDAQQEIQALGTAGQGVTILPNARGIAPA